MSTIIHINIDQGSDVDLFLKSLRDSNGVAIDSTFATGKCTVKPNYTANTGFDFGVAFRVNGKVFITASETLTATMPPGVYVYDVVRNSPEGKNDRIVSGSCTVNPGVTTANTALYNNVPPVSNGF